MTQASNKEGTRDYYVLDRPEPALPAAWYFDPDQYRRELDAVWNTHWVYCCHSSALQDTGSYQTLSIGDQNVWVVRRADGDVAGYHNACRHRGSILLTEGGGKLSTPSVSCPYHRWRYAIDDGSLIGISSYTEPEGFERCEHSLFPIAVHQWRGLVFVNLDPEAQWDADAVFDASWQEMNPFPIEQRVLGHQWSKTLACNWKTFWDNYGECLHCPGVHRNLSQLVPIFKRGLLGPQDLPDWQTDIENPDPAFRGGLREGAETFSVDGSTQGHVDTHDLPQEARRRGVTYATSFPSVYIGTHIDHTRVVRIVPRGPELIELSIDWLFPPAALADPDYDIANVTDFAKEILEEDGAVCELAQRGMHAAPMECGILMPEEYELKAFKDWLLAALEHHGNPMDTQK